MKFALPILMLVLMASINSDAKPNGESQQSPAFEDRMSLAQEPLVEEDRALSRKLLKEIDNFKRCMWRYLRDFDYYWPMCVKKSSPRSKKPSIQTRDQFIDLQECVCSYYFYSYDKMDMFVTCVEELDRRFRGPYYQRCGTPL